MQPQKNQNSYKHNTRIRVRYAETDCMGVAYHSNFFIWFEVGRTDLIRALGCPYSEMEAKGYFLPVLEASCKYLKPVRYDQELHIITWFESVEGARLKINYEARLADEVVARGLTIHTFVDAAHRPKRPPDFFLAIVK